MTKASLYNLEGKKVGDVTLSDVVFGLAKNDTLVHQVYVAQAANRRTGSAHTKLRSEVRGGGKKPWKQKGTGNARTGSIRNTIWRGGGTIFGPRKERNFTKQINTKMRRKALLAVLSEKARGGKIVVAETLALPELKTKTIATFLDKAGVGTSAVVALGTKERTTFQAARNIPKIRTYEAEKMNVFDLLNTEYLVMSQDTLANMEKQFSA